MSLRILTLALATGCIETELSKQPGAVGHDTATPDTGDGPEQPDYDTGDPSAPPTEVHLGAPDGVVLDPKLMGEPTLNLVVESDAEGCTIGVQVDNGIGQVATLEGEATAWDGRDDGGLWFEPGPARAQARIDCGDGPELDQALDLHIVRLGLQSIDLHSPELHGGEVALAFHKSGLLGGAISEIGDRPEYALDAGPGAAAGAVDDDTGLARAIPRWTNPDSPPWATGTPAAHNVPAAFVAASPIEATLTLGATAISQSRSIPVPALGPRADAVPTIRLVGSEVAVLPGEAITVELDPAQATMGREVRTIDWAFEAIDASGAVTPIPGHIQTEHTLYTLAGQPSLLDGSEIGLAPAVPWIGVLSDTADALEGVEAEAAPVLDALRDYLFEHDYIAYDPGDSAYTEFEGAYMYWSSITADLTGFLDRSSGLNLYCHSMSCLLSALAGNVGVEAPQIVLGTYFTTNQTRAAGGTAWRRWSFNSHSVVTPDGGETIWDSSIALDGDDEPHAEPIEEIMPRGMSGEEYFWRLTYDDIEIINSGLCFIR